CQTNEVTCRSMELAERCAKTQVQAKVKRLKGFLVVNVKRDAHEISLLFCTHQEADLRTSLHVEVAERVNQVDRNRQVVQNLSTFYFYLYFFFLVKLRHLCTYRIVQQFRLQGQGIRKAKVKETTNMERRTHAGSFYVTGDVRKVQSGFNTALHALGHSARSKKCTQRNSQKNLLHSRLLFSLIGKYGQG